jgi:regulator of sigma E protease
MIISTIAFIVVFSVVTLAHELGHFIFSKKAGIKVLELGLGFGPKIYSFTKDGTIFSLNMIPVLAFVRIGGLDEIEGREASVPLSESYVSKTPAQKFMSIFGGPLFNILLAFLISYFMFTFTGVPREMSNEIATINPGSIAEKAGLMSGDRILSISGRKTNNMAEAVEYIHKSAGKQLILTIDRSGKTLRVKAVPELNKKMGIALIGFSLKPNYYRTDPVRAIYEAGSQVLSTCAGVLYILGLLMIGKISVLELAGPVGIAQFTGQVAGEGFIPLLSFTAFLSINLGLLNLLPLPALDGGRLVFILIEAIRRKAIDMKLENKIHQVGLTVLLALMAVITVNDIYRIFRK